MTCFFFWQPVHNQTNCSLISVWSFYLWRFEQRDLAKTLETERCQCHLSNNHRSICNFTKIRKDCCCCCCCVRVCVFGVSLTSNKNLYKKTLFLFTLLKYWKIHKKKNKYESIVVLSSRNAKRRIDNENAREIAHSQSCQITFVIFR